MGKFKLLYKGPPHHQEHHTRDGQLGSRRSESDCLILDRE